MTNLTRLRLILVDLSGLTKKKHLKQNILFFKKLGHLSRGSPPFHFIRTISLFVYCFYHLKGVI